MTALTALTVDWADFQALTVDFAIVYGKMRSDSHPFRPNSLVYRLTVRGHSCDCGAYWRDCPLGSLEALALGAHIERLKELVGLEVCELPKFGRVKAVHHSSTSGNQSNQQNLLSYMNVYKMICHSTLDD